MKEKKVKVLITLPESIKAWLDSVSGGNDRTASGEVTSRLRRMMEQETGNDQVKQA